MTIRDEVDHAMDAYHGDDLQRVTVRFDEQDQFYREVGLTPAPDYPGSSDVEASYRGMSIGPGMSPDEIVLVTGERRGASLKVLAATGRLRHEEAHQVARRTDWASAPGERDGIALPAGRGRGRGQGALQRQENESGAVTPGSLASHSHRRSRSIRPARPQVSYCGLLFGGPAAGGAAGTPGVVAGLDLSSGRQEKKPMAKYAPLASYLRRQKRPEVTLSFRDIERIVSGILPKAATTESWWRPASGATAMPQHLALADAGFVAEPQLRTETVRFVRADPVRSDAPYILMEER